MSIESLVLGVGLVLVLVFAIASQARSRAGSSTHRAHVEAATHIGNTGERCDLEAVGESYYQQALRAVAGAGEVRHECTAALVLEDSNQYDPNAVQVVIGGQLVGYLSRADAKAYRKHISSLGRIVGSCPAVIVGGGHGKQLLGVWLGLNPRKKR